MFWLMLLALMILIPVAVAVLAWREARQLSEAQAAEPAPSQLSSLPADAAAAQGGGTP